MTTDFTAIITGDGERAQAWREILGTNSINIKSPIPSRANLPGKPDSLIYELDVASLDQQQRHKLILYLAGKFDESVAEVAKSLDAEGVPILADDIIVSIQNPQKWFG